MATDITKILIGETTALIPQAGASTAPEHLLDGGSGDTDFPYGKFKAIATVGEIDPKTGHVLTGWPDGQAAWLLDEDTIRVAYQSESYATFVKETYGWKMDSGVSFTGSHVHVIDYNRAAFADFLNNNSPASKMFEGAGHLFNTVYNVFGEIVDGKNADPKDLSAKWGNQTGADGTLYEFDERYRLTQGDWFFHSFCGAYYEEANKYGNGIGFADDVWLMGEEWNIGQMYSSRGGDKFFTDNTMGLASMVVDIANKTAYTVPVLGQSGYEKILPINSGHKDYVVLVMSGYNLEVEPAPLKIYIGKKNVDAAGKAMNYNTASARDAFLGRNGLLFGQLYGMAATNDTYADLGIANVDADTEMLNAYTADADAPDTFKVRYYPTKYRWDGFDTPENAGKTEVYRWLQDGDTVGGVKEANEQPEGYTFFNGDSKVEHPAVDPDITQSRYVINLTDARSILGIDFNNIVTDLTNDADGNGLPDYLSADVTRVLAGVDGALVLETNGKGAAPTGPNNPASSLTHAIHVEQGKAYADQPDGLQWVKTSDGDYLILDEDSGNDYGERKYVLPIDSETLQLTDPGTGYFLASAGGSLNPRAKDKVAAIPGTFSRATGAEFSGTWNVTHLVAKKEDGSFYTQEELDGTGAQRIIGSLPLEEQTFIGVVQQGGESGGILAERKADQGGQIFMFNITEPLEFVKPLITGTPNADTIQAGVGEFTGVNSLVFTGAGKDEVDIPIGGAKLYLGSNSIFTGSGADTISVADEDRAFGGSGDDEFDATEATGYRISGGVGNDIFYLGVNGRAIGGDGDDRFFVGEGGGNIISGGAGADQFWILTDDPTKLKASNTIVDYTIGTDVIGIANQVADSVDDLTLSGSNISLNGVLIATLNGVNAASATFVFG
ncbi:calcium-binding protein [Cylindrospermopsis raciborskii GIHE 2018]|nr:calcium-binding protein [Cylindrospermopsis raciborskii GIHE 2018]